MASLLFLITMLYTTSIRADVTSWNTLNKYIVIAENYHRDDGQSECNTRFGTSLASIHNAEDEEYTQALCQDAVNDHLQDWNNKVSDGCRIGLDDDNDNDEFRWMDGTSTDYTAWGPGEPGHQGPCILLEQDGGYLWGEISSDSDETYILCNRPSELCTADSWTVDTQASHWTFSTDDSNCDVSNNNDGSSVDVATLDLAGHNWSSIRVDYMLRITSDSSLDGYAGIAVHLVDADMVDSNTYELYVGLRVTSGSHNVFYRLTHDNGQSGSSGTFGFDAADFHEVSMELDDRGTLLLKLNAELHRTESFAASLPARYKVDHIEMRNEYLSSRTNFSWRLLTRMTTLSWETLSRRWMRRTHR